MTYYIQYIANKSYVFLRDSYGNQYDSMYHFKTKIEAKNFIIQSKGEYNHEYN